MKLTVVVLQRSIDQVANTEELVLNSGILYSIQVYREMRGS